MSSLIPGRCPTPEISSTYGKSAQQQMSLNPSVHYREAQELSLERNGSLNFDMNVWCVRGFGALCETCYTSCISEACVTSLNLHYRWHASKPATFKSMNFNPEALTS